MASLAITNVRTAVAGSSAAAAESGSARQIDSNIPAGRGDRMSDIQLVKPHSLPIAKAKALVKKEADALAAEYDLSSEWRGNTLHFHRSGVNGQMYVTDSEIRLHVTLGFLLKPLKGKFVGHIERNLDRLLAEQEPRAQAKKPARKTVRTEQ
jgi:putative polyhydroxyalkanoate system protein